MAFTDPTVTIFNAEVQPLLTVTILVGITERPNMVMLGTMTARSGETICIIDESATVGEEIVFTPQLVRWSVYCCIITCLQLQEEEEEDGRKGGRGGGRGRDQE